MKICSICLDLILVNMGKVLRSQPFIDHVVSNTFTEIVRLLREGDMEKKW